MNRKNYILTLLDIPFKSIVVKYDYYLEGEVDFILNELKEIDPRGASTHIVLLNNHRVVINLPSEQNLLIWNLQTRNIDSILKGHTDVISVVRVLKDNRIVSVAEDDLIKIWNSDTGICEHTLSGHTSFVMLTEISSDNRIISVENEGPNIRVWNPDTGNCELVIRENLGFSTSLLIMGNKIIVGVSDNDNFFIRIWDINSGKLLHSLKGHTSFINHLNILDEQRIVSGSADTTLRIWNLKTYTCEKILNGHRDSIVSILIMPDKTIISSSFDETLKIWKNGEKMSSLIHLTGVVSTLKILPDGKLISASHDRILRIWDLDTFENRLIFTDHEGPIEGLLILEDGGVISVGGPEDRFIIVWK